MSEREKERESESERERHNLGHLWSWETYFFLKKFEGSTLYKDLDKLQYFKYSVFVEDGHSIDEVNTVGERLMALACIGLRVWICSIDPTVGLRYTQYQTMTVQKASFDPRRLPPIE